MYQTMEDLHKAIASYRKLRFEYQNILVQKEITRKKIELMGALLTLDDVDVKAELQVIISEK